MLSSNQKGSAARLLKQAVSSAPLRQLVRMERAKEENGRLRQSHMTPLDQSLLENTKLLADREELLKRLPKGGRVVEIGVAAGGFSERILAVCEPRELHLIDFWGDESRADYSASSFARVQSRFADEIAEGRVVMHRGLSVEMLADFEDDSVDWVYVDAGHDYASVAADLAECARIVRAGGIIAGHDYVRWVNSWSVYGVVEAVNELAMQTGSPFLFLTNQADKHDSFALRLQKAS